MRYDLISPQDARTIAGLFRERLRRSPDAVAYHQFDAASQRFRDYTWLEMAALVGRWQEALAREGYARGDRIAIQLRNSVEWAACDIAALGLGLIVVPLYANDRADNAAFILRDSGARFLLIENDEAWRTLAPALEGCEALSRVVSLQSIADASDDRVRALDDWFAASGEFRVADVPQDELATIVYTSGTTGPPKGVMLTHRNILWNADSCLRAVVVSTQDVFLSFLPLSHALERTVGYYVPMMAGASVAFARSVAQLADDFLQVRPTIVISVPRVFERVCARIKSQLRSPAKRKLFDFAVAVGWQRFLRTQGRGGWNARELLWPVLRRLVAQKVMDRMGGRLRMAICGGARLAPETAHVFIGLGLPLLQGYGMTETSPVISTNRLEDNEPESVGAPLHEVEARIGPNQELLVRSPGVTAGYWRNSEATARLIEPDGWLHTGDCARIEHGRIFITGRLKEIIVLANGEKLPPADMEAAIGDDPLFEQVMIVGEGRPYLSALVVLNSEAANVAHDENAEGEILEHIGRQLTAFPGYAQVRRAAVCAEPWTIDNGLMTPSLKLKRTRILEQYQETIERLYAGH